MTTVRSALSEGTDRLGSLETPFLDATVLLAHALGITKERLLASYPEEIPKSILSTYNSYLGQRLSGIPVSYILCKKEFYGLPFYVDKRVLVPRPETETLIEAALDEIKSYPEKRRLLDVCTGSGCIAITLSYLHPELFVSASDISLEALEVARLNSRHLLSTAPRFIESDLFEEVEGKFDIIVSNPPYLTEEETEDMQIKGWPEPIIALNGGEDGLTQVREIAQQGFDHLTVNGYLLIEGDVRRVDAIAEILDASGYKDISIYPDLSGRGRAAGGRKPSI
ncbi:MAG: peptide chain release factor N(5)-glutamine methyltransferase [Spirochaetia bacterium]